jgi:hypothetical protein
MGHAFVGRPLAVHVANCTSARALLEGKGMDGEIDCFKTIKKQKIKLPASI